MNKLNLIFKMVISLFAVAWIFKEVVIPLSVGAYYHNDYQRLVVACDTAMDDSWYYGKDNKNTEIVHLMDCHEYDKARKVMLMSGLPEEYLSYLGLKALEIYQRPADEFAEQHRFERR